MPAPPPTGYIMEHADEAARLEMKTDFKRLAEQAQWAGIRPGMRVADIGCGSGITTSYLHQLVQPGGQAIGIDASEARIAHAREHYAAAGIEFVCRSFYDPLDGIGEFDFIWVRFVLEYHRAGSPDIVRNIARQLRPGGILCLIDLDYNCLNHFGHSPRLERSIRGVMDKLEKERDFDPYVGRKLYSFLYDLDFLDISVDIGMHHLIYGELGDVDAYNWTKKVEVAAKDSGYRFEEYHGGYDEFREEFKTFFSDPRRFTYTPLICCRGCRPLESTG